MLKKENIVIIGSSGKNCGKTLFACKLIKQLATYHEVIGVKITAIREDGGKCPRGDKGCGVCGSLNVPYLITVEADMGSMKDTSRMLQAGARKVFWLRVKEKFLQEGIDELIRLIPLGAIVVCESNSMRSVVDPGLFIIIRNTLDYVPKTSFLQVCHLADKIVLFDGGDWNFPPERIHYENNRWILREKATAVILAGGKSLRMGVDKSFLTHCGKYLISSVSDQLLPYFDEVIIGANDSEKFKFLNLRVIPDIERNKGPLMGIVSSLKSSHSDLNFVTACDIPVMNIRLIHNMLTLAADYDIVVPVSGDGCYEPLFAVYSKRIIKCADEVLNKDKRKITDLFSGLNVKCVDIDNNGWYYNLNSKHNYLEFIKMSAMML